MPGNRCRRRSTAALFERRKKMARALSTTSSVACRHRDIYLILAALFELRLTCIENESTWKAIGDLAEKLGGDRSAVFFGAPPPERAPSSR